MAMVMSIEAASPREATCRQKQTCSRPRAVRVLDETKGRRAYASEDMTGDQWQHWQGNRAPLRVRRQRAIEGLKRFARWEGDLNLLYPFHLVPFGDAFATCRGTTEDLHAQAFRNGLLGLVRTVLSPERRLGGLIMPIASSR